MPALDSIEDFLALTRTASFTRAAAARHVTQPAFTRRIQNLEGELGTALFDRTQTPIALTRAGLRFLSYAQNLSTIYGQAQTDVAAAASQISNPVRFAAPHTLATTFFPAFWRECLRAKPSMKVSLTGQRIESCITDLQEGHVDLALVQITKAEMEHHDFSNLLVLKISTDRLIPAIAPFAEKAQNKWLAYAPEVALGGYVRDALPQKTKEKLEIIFESPSSEVLKAMTLAGHGFAYLPESLIEDELRDGYLKTPATKLPSVALDIILLRATKQTSPDLDVLWKVAKAYGKTKGRPTTSNE